MPDRFYYSNSIKGFLEDSVDHILGVLTRNGEFDLNQNQRDAWLCEIELLKKELHRFTGKIYFEYTIPRMGKRIDVLCIIGHIIFILEFKVGSDHANSFAIDQVMDYALDLKNFHEGSHDPIIAPILIATESGNRNNQITFTQQGDKVLQPIVCNPGRLTNLINELLNAQDGELINSTKWEESGYHPTPTIIEAALSLYNGHSVSEITRSEATGQSLIRTSELIDQIIEKAKRERQKVICFVTGVPGAGKTLIGLNVATKNIDRENEIFSVFLSGNGPLVNVLREALARDRVNKCKAIGERITKKNALSEVKTFIQNVHNFRDDCLSNRDNPPFEHVVLFDEAQRAWDVTQTRSFMKQKKHIPNFNLSEPEFLISCLDRHPDWAVIVCLVGGGQEINTGEAGIREWIYAINNKFEHWHVYISPQLRESEYDSDEIIRNAETTGNLFHRDELHLSVSMRSFRAENLSYLVKEILDLNINKAQQAYKLIKSSYPIMITRDINRAKEWVRSNARGSERYGLIASSQAERLRPLAINVKSPMDPIHWFLNEKTDIRSSYFLEEVATEFHIQGLEIDWACVTWDADFRFSSQGWHNFSFKGHKWTNINQVERKKYQKNAYRVLLTRARQGMVIVVPQGNREDLTRLPEFYDPTFEYLQSLGFQVI